ncbi:MAG: DUF4209 domain-containing protein [Rhodobacteraceae bacterium]|nr:DUF4209 domain-containing protein [Paracoccaceae bacterium]
MTKNRENGEPKLESTKIVSLKDFSTVDFEEPLKKLNSVDCSELAKLFSAEGKKRELEEKNQCSEVFFLLASVCEIGFSPEIGRNDQAFPSYSKEQTNVLAKLVPSIGNPTLQARLADIAWQNDRSLTDMANYAVKAYTRSVSEVLKGNFIVRRSNSNPGSNLGCDYLFRALQISNAKGSKVTDQEIDRMKTLITDVSKHSQENRVYPGYIRLPRMCLDYSIGSPVKIAEDAKGMAKNQDIFVLHRQELWRLAAEGYRKGHCEEDEKRCRIEAAECNVEMSMLFEGGGIVAVQHLNKAIKELLQISGTKERRKKIEEKLREVQKHIPDQMGRFPCKFNITPFVDFVRTSIGGINFPNVLYEFAFLDEPADPAALEKEVHRGSEVNPFQLFVSPAVFDREGRNKTDTLQPGGDDWVRQQILQNECNWWQISAEGIELARMIIQNNHSIQKAHFQILADQSCFIAEEKKPIVATGLENFFCGNFISAVHILVPQLESSLRYMLEQAGANTTTMQTDMTQESLSLSQILGRDKEYRQQIEEILGDALVFAMDNLFNCKGGPSLRHNLTHGLLSANDCAGSNAIYACWLIYHFYFGSLVSTWDRVKELLERVK